MDWNEIAEIIGKAKNIIAFTGAGISTNCGIPDFRGERGLYETAREKYDLPHGEAIFDINFFKENPQPFFDLSKELIDSNFQPTLCHQFLVKLERQDKMERIITQNIDRLHQRAGTKKLLECHGTYDRGHCGKCGGAYVYDDYRDAIREGRIPYCQCGGVIKPDVVFFGESLPHEFYRLWENPPGADLILILGTSLSVRPAADLALKIAAHTKSILVNRDRTDYDSLLDYTLHEDLDEFAGRMSESLFAVT